MILKEGIKYNSLSAKEREQLEEVWQYEQAVKALEEPALGMVAEEGAEYGQPRYVRDINSNEIFNYIYNKDTVDAVLQDLMENGIKVQYGERIGKTIIFAYNHRHAEMIVERFYRLYPEYGPDFCVLIDNYVTYAQDLINRFEVRDANPQIAVSVDMLDTGIDVPDIVNLVFFKTVKSRIKYEQMKGRGTRLSPDLFGEGKDKEGFYIFDWCRNLEFFEDKNNGESATTTMSLTERLFGLRAEIAFHLQHQQYQEDEFARGLHDELKSMLKEQVATLSDTHISVRTRWEQVSRFKTDEAWISLSLVDVQTLKTDIAPLLPKNTAEVTAKMFDAIMLCVQLGLVDEEYNASSKIEKVRTLAGTLVETKATLPQVQSRMGTLKEVLSATAWENASLRWLEKVRKDLRELMQFLREGKGRWFVVDIKDVITDEGETTGVSPRITYK
jgi:type I restriction enzyme R subunit